jgi:hypothetical protein
MKATCTILAAVATAGFGLSLQAQLVNGIKAIVHDAVVTKWEVEKSTEAAAEQLLRDYRTQPEVYERKIAQALNENLEERL